MERVHLLIRRNGRFFIRIYDVPDDDALDPIIREEKIERGVIFALDTYHAMGPQLEVNRRDCDNEEDYNIFSEDEPEDHEMACIRACFLRVCLISVCCRLFFIVPCSETKSFSSVTAEYAATALASGNLWKK